MSKALEQVRKSATNYVDREMVDFIGRMNGAFADVENCCPDGSIEPGREDEYREAMVELAALALAQIEIMDEQP